MQLSDIRRRLYEATNYRLRHVAGGRLASVCRPISIVFLLTEFCNARCVHCDIWKNAHKEDPPTPERWKGVLDDLRSWLGPVQVVFSGGEALLRPWATEVVRHAAGLGFFVEHLTHGYWADQGRIEQLALAGPRRITVSLDGIGAVHDLVRGRAGFFERTQQTIRTLQQLQARGSRFSIRLKTVLMAHNLQEAEKIARYASVRGTDVFYQPIEQNYNTPEDRHWFASSQNWPTDSREAVAVVRRLTELKREGLHIANSVEQLEAMERYFNDPEGLRVAVQSHSAHEARRNCAALTMLQFQSNGDVRTCSRMPPVGNIKTERIRKVWQNRPRFWEGGCCLEARPTHEGSRSGAVEA